MTAKAFVQSLDLANKCSPQTFMAPQAAKNLSVRLNTCLNTSFLVSTPADQHLFPRLNTWLLNAESCLTSENRRPCPARRNAEMREPSGSGAAALVCASALCASWLSVLKYFALYRVHRGDAQK